MNQYFLGAIDQIIERTRSLIENQKSERPSAAENAEGEETKNLDSFIGLLSHFKSGAGLKTEGLRKELLDELQKEMEEAQHRNDYVLKAKSILMVLKSEVLKIIEEIQITVFTRFLVPNMMTDFITDFLDGGLNEDETFQTRLIKILTKIKENNNDSLHMTPGEVLEVLDMYSSSTLKSLSKLKTTIISQQNELDSKIVRFPHDVALIHKFLKPIHRDPKLFLLYRGSRDGFSSLKFHELCNNRGPTLTIIKTSLGKCFGGYAHESWQSTGGYTADPNAFLFSMDTREKYKQFAHKEKALVYYATYGPTFGKGHDIFVASNCSAHENSYSEWGVTFKTKDTPSEDIRGNRNFRVADYEVFMVQSQPKT